MRSQTLAWGVSGAMLETACLKGRVELWQENGSRENGHVPGLGQVTGTGHQVKVLDFE